MHKANYKRFTRKRSLSSLSCLKKQKLQNEAVRILLLEKSIEFINCQ